MAVADALMFIGQCAWYLAPMGMANTAPVLMRNTFPALAIPVDRLFGNHGIFGSHKTVRGLLVAVPFGLATFLLEQRIAVASPAVRAFGLFDYPSMTLWFGVLAGAGAILGDLIRSALKRRASVRPGGKFVPLDQLDYLLGGMLFTAAFFRPAWPVVLMTLFVGGVLHAFSSWLAYVIGLKEDRL